MGGSDSIEVTPFDAACKPSDDFSRRMARNTQVILKQEAYLDRVADPAGGSYYVESLTDSLAREAWKLFQEVEAKGGLLKAMQSGFVQQEIATLPPAKGRSHRGAPPQSAGNQSVPGSSRAGARNA